MVQACGHLGALIVLSSRPTLGNFRVRHVYLRYDLQP